MNLLFYKVLHVLGMLLLFTALGGLAAESARREGRTAGWKKLSMVHGAALVLILLSGFGMLAKLGGGFPGWVVAKIVIWLLLGAAVVLVRRMPGMATLWWWSLPVVGAIAAYLALYKPF